MEEFKYTVKVINAGNSSGYVIKKWDINARFSNVSDLKDQLASDLPHYWKMVPIFCLGTFSVAMVRGASNFPSQKMMTFKACIMMSIKEEGR